MYLKNCLPRRDEVLSMVRSRQGISRRGFRMRDGSMRGCSFIQSFIHSFTILSSLGLCSGQDIHGSLFLSLEINLTLPNLEKILFLSESPGDVDVYVERPVLGSSPAATFLSGHFIWHS